MCETILFPRGIIPVSICCFDLIFTLILHAPVFPTENKTAHAIYTEINYIKSILQFAIVYYMYVWLE